MKSFEENTDEPKFTNGQAIEVATEDDGTLSQQVADIEMREYQRITNIRLGNIQLLLEAILDQNRKGMKTKTQLVDIELAVVPTLDTP